MFEKCGLRDIFVRIAKLKWLLLVCVIIGAAVGSLMYVKGVQNAKASALEEQEKNKYEHVMYTGHAFYYNHVDVTAADTSARKQSDQVFTYTTLFAMRSTSASIYSSLLENHKAEELGELLDVERYAEKSPNKEKLYNKNYGLKASAVNTMLEVVVCAETRDMCKELLKVCRDKLVSISKKIPDSTLRFEGQYIRKENVDDEFFVSIYDTQEEEIEEEKTDTPGIGTIVLWLAIFLLIGIVIAIGAAIFVPTINRDSDFEAYGIDSLGTVKKDGAPMIMRLIRKKAEEKGAKNIMLITTLKNDKKTSDSFGRLKTAADAEGMNLTLVYQPAEIAESIDKVMDGDMLIAVEKRGVSRHKKFDEMKHYLEQMGENIEYAFLLKK